MSSSLTNTSERLLPDCARRTKEAYLVYLRHLFAYTTVPQFFSAGSRLLEVGCGEGYGTWFLAQQGYVVVGIDVDPQVVAHASKKYGTEQCEFRVTTGTAFPYPNECFDGVVSFQVIEHVQDERTFLTEIVRVLKHDGKCVLTTPNKLYRVRPNRAPWNRFHLREYTPEEFEQLLARIFEDVQVWGIRGTDEIQAIEYARVKQVQKLVDRDLFHLRRLLPPGLETCLATWLKKLRKNPSHALTDQDYLNTYEIHDYTIMTEHVEESLDLIAVCRKPSACSP